MKMLESWIISKYEAAAARTEPLHGALDKFTIVVDVATLLPSPTCYFLLTLMSFFYGRVIVIISIIIVVVWDAN